MKFNQTYNITQNKHIVQKRLETITFFEKHGLQATIDEYCIQEGIQPISVSLIVKIIRRNNWYFKPIKSVYQVEYQERNGRNKGYHHDIKQRNQES